MLNVQCSMKVGLIRTTPPLTTEAFVGHPSEGGEFERSVFL